MDSRSKAKLIKRLAGNKFAVAAVLADAALRTKLYKEAKFWYLQRGKTKKTAMPYRRRYKRSYGKRRKTQRRLKRRRLTANRGYVHRAINRKQDINTNYLLQLNGNINSGQLYDTILGSTINQGLTAGGRLGDSIFYKGFKIHLFFRNLYTTPLENNDAMLRMMLVKNLTPTEDPDVKTWQRESDTNTPLDFDTTGNTMQILRKLNRNRFKVIRDWRYSLHAPNQNKPGNSTVLKKLYFPINRRLTFNTDTLNKDKVRPQYLLMYFVEFRDGTVPITDNIEGNIKMWEYYNP